MVDSPNASGEESAGSGRRSIYRNPFLWAALVGVLGVTLIRPLFRQEPEPPPKLWQIPEFQLVNQHGQPAGSAALKGKVYVLNVFFTSCKAICPKLMRAMKTLQTRYKKWGTSVHLVSISVDPTNDTAERLKRYGEKMGIDFASWTLLTGEEKAIRALITKGFKTHVGEKRSQGGILDIAHTGNVALVDGAGWLRGTFRTDAEGLDEVFHRSQHTLLAERRN